MSLPEISVLEVEKSGEILDIIFIEADQPIILLSAQYTPHKFLSAKQVDNYRIMFPVEWQLIELLPGTCTVNMYD